MSISLQSFRRVIARFCQDTEGQDLVEYSLLLAFIALGAVAILSSVGGSITSLWSTAGSMLSSSATAAS